MYLPIFLATRRLGVAGRGGHTRGCLAVVCVHTSTGTQV